MRKSGESTIVDEAGVGGGRRQDPAWARRGSWGSIYTHGRSSFYFIVIDQSPNPIRKIVRKRRSSDPNSGRRQQLVIMDKVQYSTVEERAGKGPHDGLFGDTTRKYLMYGHFFFFASAYHGEL